jgi:putative transcriptional regulator
MSKMFNDLKRGLSEVDAFLSGQKEGFKVTVPAGINVKEIRAHLNMTQKRFSNCFGFSLDAIKHWEGGRRTPEAPVRAFLTVIARNPKAVLIALHPKALGTTRLPKPAQKRKATRSAASSAS